jgi:hypothetical protein
MAAAAATAMTVNSTSTTWAIKPPHRPRPKLPRFPASGFYHGVRGGAAW